MAYAHVDRGSEGHGDQQDEDQRLPGQAPAHLRTAADGRGMIADPLLRGEFLEAGSADERLVEDDGSILFLATTRSTLGGPLRWVSRSAHTFRVGREDLR
ncbi:hypothetical protein GCM10018775_17830 [Streptomyces umbrinus]|nr:hypothetical protein GCM10018775_17830 [Streptomyces umbrinus]